MATDLTIDRLKAQLLTSGLSQKDQPLFQVINQLIDYIRTTQGAINTFTGGGGGGGGGSLINMPFLTYDDAQSVLPNSRQLTRQTGISFNKTPQKLIISTELLDYNRESDYEPGLPGPPGPQGLSIIGPMGLMGPPGFDAYSEESFDFPQCPTSLNDSILFNFLTTAKSYVPQWTNTGTANTLGAGTITGTYIEFGKLVYFTLNLTWGAGTVGGSGAWLFSYPLPASAATLPRTGLNVIMIIAGNTFVGLARKASATTVLPITSATNAVVTNTTPAAWASGSELNIDGWYIQA